MRELKGEFTLSIPIQKYEQGLRNKFNADFALLQIDSDFLIIAELF